MHHIHNQTYRVSVSAEGAELVSFLDQDQMVEYLWQADPQVWPRHAPVLFPIVGKLPDNKYAYQGETYTLPQHGFARDQKFDLIDEAEDSLLFELRESEATLGQYPFRFVLQIGYRLQNNRLTITYRVLNPAKEEDLYFSIGAHPGFSCPLQVGRQFTDYFLEFEQAETLESHLLEGGLLTGQTTPVLEAGRVLPLQDDLFAKDALVFKSLASQHVTLKSNQDPAQVKVGFEGFPYLGIWSKPVGAPFICIEPWHGIASSVGGPIELTEKEGIMHLFPGQDFTCSYTIEVS